MEVDAESFPSHLLGLFINISEADFVSFDLELSGIPSRIQGKPAHGPGRFTMEERYQETKMGADRYQILQVGITCARFDYIANKYVLRPYNINISPLLNERMDFEREIIFQSGACSFLLGCGFDLGAPFARGVQYLSREEAERAKQTAWDRLENRNPIPDLQLKESDVESLDFLRRVRAAIVKWKASTSSMVEITTHTGFAEQPTIPVITRFEKRLVHQLVRAEFPELVSMGRQDCVKIIPLDPEREAENMRRIKNRVKEAIVRQSGFRWIFEALVKGGDIDSFDPLYVARTTGVVVTADAHDIRDRYDRAIERLKSKQPVLVGHNMFTDIVYLYRTFVGTLPDTLQGFQDAIHDLFPKIIDTKYLATHAEGDLNASPPLQEIAEGLAKQPLPHIITHADHSKYKDNAAFHEAGYDSLLTATIMIRLAAKLGAERKVEIRAPLADKLNLPASNNSQDAFAARDSSSDKDSFKSAKSTIDVPDLVQDGREKVQHPVPLPPVEEPQQAENVKNKKKKNKSPAKNSGKKSKEDQQRRFQTKNMFDSLRQLSMDPDDDDDEDAAEQQDEDAEPVEGTGKWDFETADTSSTWENTEYVQDKTGWVPIQQAKREAMELIPCLEEGQSAFWKEFGNVLRVFGTVVGVWRITVGWEE
jgi:poly(A)-specific ribonuclease